MLLSGSASVPPPLPRWTCGVPLVCLRRTFGVPAVCRALHSASCALLPLELGLCAARPSAYEFWFQFPLSTSTCQQSPTTSIPSPTWKQ